MSYPLPTFDQIRTAILTDWKNLDPLVDTTVDSDNHVRASGIASAILGLYQFQSWCVNQFFPDTADVENLERFASVRGITRIAAVKATGTVRFSGTPAATIPTGTIVITTSGIQYETTADGTIGGGGTVDVAASAVVAGIAGNQTANTPVTLQAAPAGVSSNAILLAMQGGMDAESLAALLERVLDRLQHPPAGGHRYDYVAWAREIVGVSAAYSYPLRRGLGTTDVAILSGGAPASDALRQTVWDYIDTKAPAGGDFRVLTPTLVPVAVTATVVLSGTLLATVQASVAATLAAYFSTLKPGDTVNRGRILAAFTDVPGVVDVTLTAPAASVPTTVDATVIQLGSLGTLTIS